MSAAWPRVAKKKLNIIMPTVSLALFLGLYLFFLGCAGSTGVQGQGSRADSPISQREVEIRLDLADAYLRNNEPRLSLRELMHIQTAAGDLPRFHYTLGYTQFVLGNWTAAVEAFQKTVSLDPGHAEAWNNLGLAYLAGSKPDAAESAFTSALGVPMYRTPEIAALNLALLHLERNDPDMAGQYVNLALELNWRFSRAYLLAAEIEAGQGDLNKAINFLEQGVAADLNDTRIMLTLSEYLLLAGREQEALVWLERVQVAAAPESRASAMAQEYQSSLQHKEAHQSNIQENPVTDVHVSQPSPELQAPGPQPSDSVPARFPIPKTDGQTEIESFYVVQVGAFLEQANAVSLRDAYLAKSYQAELVDVHHKDKQWFVVVIARTADHAQARSIAQLFQKQENAQAVVARIGMGRYLDMNTP
jgi:Tfp pilus assembly protein PilF